MYKTTIIPKLLNPEINENDSSLEIKSKISRALVKMFPDTKCPKCGIRIHFKVLLAIYRESRIEVWGKNRCCSKARSYYLNSIKDLAGVH